jgi:hypothetical protein
MTTVHVIPTDDLIEHETDGDDCVCGPTIEMTEGGWLVTHHSLDGRERGEPPQRDSPLFPHHPEP